MSFHKLFSPLDRANILHNVFAEAYRILNQTIDPTPRSERTNYATVVDLLAYLRNEKEYLPWQTLFKHVNDLLKVLDYKQSFYQVSVNVISNVYLENIKHRILIHIVNCSIHLGES